MTPAEPTPPTVAPLAAVPGEHEKPQSESESLFVSVDYLATAIGVSRRKVIRAFHDGFIPGLKWDATYHLLREFVEGLIAEVKAGGQIHFAEYAASWRAKATEGAA